MTSFDNRYTTLHSFTDIVLDTGFKMGTIYMLTLNETNASNQGAFLLFPYY